MIQPLMVKNSETGLAGKLKGIKRGEIAAGAYPGRVQDFRWKSASIIDLHQGTLLPICHLVPHQPPLAVQN